MINVKRDYVAQRKAQRRQSAVRWSDLVAIRFESFMESDSSLRYISVERQSQEDLWRHPLQHKPWHVLEATSLVVIRMPHETAALSIKVF